MSFPSLVLAAGAGRRLGAANRPKVLVEVAGVPLLVRLLRQLVKLGTSQITIAIGAHGEMVRDAVLAEKLPVPVSFIENADYATTNNSYTLHLCSEPLALGGLLIEGDVAADDSVFRALLDSPSASGWAVRSPGEILDGAFLEADARGVLNSLRIIRGGDGPPQGYKSTGILKLSPALGAKLSQWIAAEVSVRKDRYYDLVFADHLAEAGMAMVIADGGRWIEIDSPADLALAESMFGGTP